MFALKLCSPNKIFLLRGFNEVSTRTSGQLYKECARKYGSVNGKSIYGALIKVFAKLPIALVVDDAVLCTHSAIPSASNSLDDLLKLPKELSSLERDSKLAYEIITRYPKWSSKRLKQAPKTKSKNARSGSNKSAEKSKSNAGKSESSKSNQLTSFKSVSN